MGLGIRLPSDFFCEELPFAKFAIVGSFKNVSGFVKSLQVKYRGDSVLPHPYMKNILFLTPLLPVTEQISKLMPENDNALSIPIGSIWLGR